jgi:hypothetical protein
MNKINRLIDLNIKIEGLLRVLVVRDSEAAENALDQCINEFNEIYESIKEPEESVAEQPVVEQPTIAETIEPVAEVVAEAQPEIVIEPEQEPKQEPGQGPEVLQESEPEQPIVEEPVPAPTPAPEPTIEAEPKFEAEAEVEAKTESEPESDVEVIVDEDDTTIDNESDNNIKVDEMISRQEALDLKKAFTINDKFRFRRELFGNSEENFVDTIDLITAMKSFDEAQEYLYEDLGWDRKNEDVADFMTIIAKHFNA